MRLFSINVHVDFPALQAYLDYLKSRDAAQAKIDELAGQVAQLTGRLQQSSAGLQGSVEQNKET